MTEWRAVPDFPGYEVSDDGRVRSLDRVIIRSNGRPLPVRGRTLRPHPAKDGGYPIVNLHRGDERKAISIHTLVLITFVGPRPNGMEALHGDGDPWNCVLGNLRYGTHAENMRDSVRHGTHVNASRTHCSRGHRLGVPNVSPASRVQGSRSCLACHQAKDAARYYGHDEAWVQRDADRRYDEITGGAR